MTTASEIRPLRIGRCTRTLYRLNPYPLGLPALEEVPAQRGGVGLAAREARDRAPPPAPRPRSRRDRGRRRAPAAPRPGAEREQDEAVRLEELAQVDLGQQARVARVAGTLEAVDRVARRAGRSARAGRSRAPGRPAGRRGRARRSRAPAAARGGASGACRRGRRTPSSNGKLVASPSTNSALPGARSRASSSSSGTRSTPTTSRTSGASASASAPAPQPTSIARSSPRGQDERLHLLGELGGARVLVRGDLLARFARSGPQPSTTTRRARVGIARDAADELVA